MNRIFVFIVIVFVCNMALYAQPVPSSFVAELPNDFLTFQKNFPRVQQAFTNKLDTIIKQCEAKNIKWPIKQIYLRSFKVDNILEIWVKDSLEDKYKFYKQMKVCASAGRLGPKRKEGDKQVPEGFYLIDRFNPNSNYHLSLGVSYPNVSDRILADSVRPGGDIYVHGNCVSIGCLAINDEQIEELYVMAAMSRNEGQEFQPIHIFPGKFTGTKARDTITKLAKDNPDYTSFIAAMRRVYYYFEKDRELPCVMINKKGNYVIDDVEIVGKSGAVLKIKTHDVRKYKTAEVKDIADTMAIFPDGVGAYMNFLQNLTNELKAALDDGVSKSLIQIEFVVNTDGKVSNVLINRGGNEQIDEIIKNRLEAKVGWKPAILANMQVPYLMKQNLFVDNTEAKFP